MYAPRGAVRVRGIENGRDGGARIVHSLDHIVSCAFVPATLLSSFLLGMHARREEIAGGAR